MTKMKFAATLTCSLFLGTSVHAIDAVYGPDGSRRVDLPGLPTTPAAAAGGHSTKDDTSLRDLCAEFGIGDIPVSYSAADYNYDSQAINGDGYQKFLTALVNPHNLPDLPTDKYLVCSDFDIKMRELKAIENSIKRNEWSTLADALSLVGNYIKTVFSFSKGAGAVPATPEQARKITRSLWVINAIAPLALESLEKRLKRAREDRGVEWGHLYYEYSGLRLKRILDLADVSPNDLAQGDAVQNTAQFLDLFSKLNFLSLCYHGARFTSGKPSVATGNKHAQGMHTDAEYEELIAYLDRSTSQQAVIRVMIDHIKGRSSLASHEFVTQLQGIDKDIHHTIFVDSSLNKGNSQVRMRLSYEWQVRPVLRYLGYNSGMSIEDISKKLFMKSQKFNQKFGGIGTVLFDDFNPNAITDSARACYFSTISASLDLSVKPNPEDPVFRAALRFLYDVDPSSYVDTPVDDKTFIPADENRRKVLADRIRPQAKPRVPYISWLQANGFSERRLADMEARVAARQGSAETGSVTSATAGATPRLHIIDLFKPEMKEGHKEPVNHGEEVLYNAKKFSAGKARLIVKHPIDDDPSKDYVTSLVETWDRLAAGINTPQVVSMSLGLPNDKRLIDAFVKLIRNPNIIVCLSIPNNDKTPTVLGTGSVTPNFLRSVSDRLSDTEWERLVMVGNVADSLLLTWGGSVDEPEALLEPSVVSFEIGKPKFSGDSFAERLYRQTIFACGRRSSKTHIEGFDGSSSATPVVAASLAYALHYYGVMAHQLPGSPRVDAVKTALDYLRLSAAQKRLKLTYKSGSFEVVSGGPLPADKFGLGIFSQERFLRHFTDFVTETYQEPTVEPDELAVVPMACSSSSIPGLIGKILGLNSQIGLFGMAPAGLFPANKLRFGIFKTYQKPTIECDGPAVVPAAVHSQFSPMSGFMLPGSDPELNRMKAVMYPAVFLVAGDAKMLEDYEDHNQVSFDFFQKDRKDFKLLVQNAQARGKKITVTGVTNLDQLLHVYGFSKDLETDYSGEANFYELRDRFANRFVIRELAKSGKLKKVSGLEHSDHFFYAKAIYGVETDFDVSQYKGVSYLFLNSEEDLSEVSEFLRKFPKVLNVDTADQYSSLMALFPEAETDYLERTPASARPTAYESNTETDDDLDQESTYIPPAYLKIPFPAFTSSHSELKRIPLPTSVSYVEGTPAATKPTLSESDTEDGDVSVQETRLKKPWERMDTRKNQRMYGKLVLRKGTN